MSTVPSPKIKFYTNHGCGWCHRVHIVLRELGLEYEEVKVDLGKPRPDWFLELNPRGLVPVIQYTPPSTSSSNETITLTESGPIVAFFTDLYPSHLLPTIESPGSPPTTVSTDAAFQRWRMSFIVDTYFSKVNPLMFKLVGAEDGSTAQEKIVDDILDLLQREIEPLLPAPVTVPQQEVDVEAGQGTGSGAGPYFGGSKTLTVVEAMITPFTIRLHAFANGIILPSRLGTEMLDATNLPRFSHWTKLCMDHPSVTYVWEREYLVKAVIERLPAVKKKYADGAK